MTHLGGGFLFGTKCGLSKSPGLRTFIPFMNTVFAVAIHPAVGLHPCPVAARSLFLDIPGMPVFMDVKNCLDYNLNLLN
jgi:hypothetical protein